MRAVVVSSYGGPDVMELREIPEPVPSSGEVLVALERAGVNPVDTYLRSGSQGYAPALPWTPGMDGAGTVLAVGGGVRNHAPGDRVYLKGSVTGTYAEACLCRSEQILPLPEGISWEEGASLGVPYYTAWRALFTLGGATEGQTVLVHGATGGVGQACLQWARSRGLRVFGSAGSQEGQRLVLSAGADLCLDHGEPDHLRALMETTGGRGVDLVIEMLADVNLADDLKILATKGRVMVVGSRGEVTIAPRDLMSVEGRIIGVRVLSADEEETEAARQAVAEGLEEGWLRPPLSTVSPLGEAPQAHRDIIGGPHLGNLVLDCRRRADSNR